MAIALARPLVLHEQNSIAGLANKVLARVADRILVAFPDTLKKPSGRGNPVRREIARLPAPEQRFRNRVGNLKVLVIGGSLGAQALNEAVPRALALIPESRRPEVTHQAGERHLDTLESAYREAGVSATTLAFIRDMAARYATADVVICRAGALTISEIAAAGIASVLIPFPRRSMITRPSMPAISPTGRRRYCFHNQNLPPASLPICCLLSPGTSCWTWPTARARWANRMLRGSSPSIAWRLRHEAQGQACSLRRHRRCRHERNRRGPAQSGFRGERLRYLGECRHATPQATGREGSISATPSRISTVPMRW